MKKVSYFPVRIHGQDIHWLIVLLLLLLLTTCHTGKSTAPHGHQTHVYQYRAIAILKKLLGGVLNMDFIQEIVNIGAHETTIINSDFAQVDCETDRFRLHGLFEQKPELSNDKRHV